MKLISDTNVNTDRQFELHKLSFRHDFVII